MIKTIEIDLEGKFLQVEYKVERGCSATYWHPGDKAEVSILEIKNEKNKTLKVSELSSSEFNTIMSIIYSSV